MLAVFPVAVFALAEVQQPGQNGITSVWTFFNRILNFIWPIFIGIAILMFIVAGFTFLTANGDPSKIKTAQHAVVWAMVGVGVAVLAYSLVIVVTNLLRP